MVSNVKEQTSFESLVIDGPVSIVIRVISGFPDRKAKRELNLSGVYTFKQRFNGKPVYKVSEENDTDVIDF